jgi:hypothetical protein
VVVTVVTAVTSGNSVGDNDGGDPQAIVANNDDC